VTHQIWAQMILVIQEVPRDTYSLGLGLYAIPANVESLNTPQNRVAVVANGKCKRQSVPESSSCMHRTRSDWVYPDSPLHVLVHRPLDTCRRVQGGKGNNRESVASDATVVSGEMKRPGLRSWKRVERGTTGFCSPRDCPMLLERKARAGRGRVGVCR